LKRKTNKFLRACVSSVHPFTERLHRIRIIAEASDSQVVASCSPALIARLCRQHLNTNPFSGAVASLGDPTDPSLSSIRVKRLAPNSPALALDLWRSCVTFLGVSDMARSMQVSRDFGLLTRDWRSWHTHLMIDELQHYDKRLETFENSTIACCWKRVNSVEVRLSAPKCTEV